MNNITRLKAVTKTDSEYNHREINPQKSYTNIPSPYPSNKISSTPYTFATLVPKTLIEEFSTQLSYIWFILIIILSFYLDIKELSLKLYTLVIFILLLIGPLIQNFRQIINRKRSDLRINHKKVTLWKPFEFISVNCEDLQVGDVILINQKEIVPADILLLASKEDGKVQVLMSHNLGCDDIVEKRALDNFKIKKGLDHNEIFLTLKKIERLSVINPNKSFDKFKAKIRYKGNPKTYNADLNHFIIGGSKIVRGDWVLGLVVYTGMETKVWINSKMNSGFKVSKMLKKLNLVHIIHFFIILCFTFISIILTYSNPNCFERYTISENIIWNFIMYGNLISISLVLTIKAAKIISAFVIRYQNTDIDINYRILQELGRVEYILADKNDLVCGEKLKITTFAIGGVYYYKQIKNKVNQTGSQYKIIKNNSPVESFEKSKSFDELINYLTTEDMSDDYLFFIFSAFFTSQKLSGFFNKVRKEDKNIIKMLEKIGLCVFRHSSNEISLRFNEVIYSYEVITEFSDQNKHYTLLKSESNEFILFKKEELSSMNETLEGRLYLNTIKVNFICDLKPLFFSYKKITPEDGESFSFYTNLASQSSVNSEGKMRQVFEKQSKDMKMLGFLGFEYRNLKKVKKTLDKLKKVGIKTWMLSGDSQENSVLSCYSSGLFTKKSKTQNLIGLSTTESCIKILNNLLQEELSNSHNNEDCTEKFSSVSLINTRIRPSIRKKSGIELLNLEMSPGIQQSPVSFQRSITLKKMIVAKPRQPALALKIPIPIPENIKLVNFNLIIDSETLNTILLTQDTRKLLVVSLFLAKSVCFYGLTPDQKNSIVHLLKYNFSFKPTVMALGASKANSAMLDEACISVKILESCKNVQDYDTSVVIPEFSKLIDIILVHGHYSYVRLSKIFHYSVYRELMICTIFFLYQFQSGYSSAFVLDSDLFIMFELFISLLPLLIIGVFEKDVSEKVAKSSGLVYSIGYFNYLMTNKRLAFYSFIGVFQGVIIYVLLFYGFGQIVNSNGFTEDSEVLGTLCFIVISLSFLQKVLITTSKFYYPTIISPFLTIGFIVLCIVLTYYEKLTVYNNSHEILINQSCFWLLVVTLPSFFTAGYFLFTSLYFRFVSMKFKNRLDMFKTSLERVFYDSDIWKEDIKHNSLKINVKSLQFESKHQELEYQNHLNSRFRLVLRIMTSLISVFMIFYLIFLYSGLIENLNYKEYAFFPAIVSIMFAIFSYVKKFKYDKLIFSLLLFILLIFITDTLLNSSFTILRYPAIEVLFSICFNFSWRLTMAQMILAFLTSVLSIAYENIYYTSSINTITSLFYIALNLGITVLSLSITYLIDYSQRKEYIFVQKVKKHFEKSNEILSFLLPEFVKKRVNDGVRYIAEEKGNVTVIFCDICDFDKIVEDYTPSEIVSLLDEFFCKLDKVCETVGVSKIETVGKTYMACAGLKDYDLDLNGEINEIPHPRRAIEMAFAVIEESQKTFLKNGNVLNVKIGIHSGPVVAGVVGFHKPQFSLVGDTVNTASRMASTVSNPNKIQISMETYRMLEDTSGLCFQNYYPEVKGKGKMRTLLVEPAKKSSENLIEEIKESRESTVYSSNFKSPHQEGIIFNLNQEAEEDILKGFNSHLSTKQKLIQILCVETQAEKEFQSIIYKNSFLMQYCGLIISAGTNIVLIIILSVQIAYEPANSIRARLAILVLESFFTLIFLKFLKRFYKSRLCAYLLNTLYWTEMVLFFILQFKYDSNFTLEILFFYFRYLLLNFCTGLFFLRSTISNISLIIILTIKLIYFSNNISDYFYTAFFIICILSITYSREFKLRADYIIRHILKTENKKTKLLLTHMLPPRVLKNLQEDVMDTDKLNAVTIMYADIVGFTAWSAKRSPSEVIGMLSELFTRFDKMCLENRIYKVYTIGDCYVAMSYNEGILRNPASEAKRMINFAFSLVRIIQEVNLSIGGGLNMRIGVHTGDVIGGINGTNIIRYDIYGKDVMIANKMESSGLPGQITISENTKQLLEDFAPDDYNFEFLKEVKAWDQLVKIYTVNIKEKLNTE